MFRVSVEAASPFPEGSLGMRVIGTQAARITALEAERDRALEVARQAQEVADIELTTARARIVDLESHLLVAHNRIAELEAQITPDVKFVADKMAKGSGLIYALQQALNRVAELEDRLRSLQSAGEALIEESSRLYKRIGADQARITELEADNAKLLIDCREAMKAAAQPVPRETPSDAEAFPAQALKHSR